MNLYRDLDDLLTAANGEPWPRHDDRPILRNGDSITVDGVGYEVLDDGTATVTVNGRPATATYRLRRRRDPAGYGTASAPPPRMVPAPEPFPPGPLQWTATRLDRPAATG